MSSTAHAKALLFALLLIAWPIDAEARAAEITVQLLHDSPQVRFAAQAIRAAADQVDTDRPCRITLRLADGSAGEDIAPEGFRIRRAAAEGGGQIEISAIDPAGLLYGGLEAAEIIRTQGVEQLRDELQNPYMKMRGTKFNIPLDVRTPSYTDVCDAAQLNIPEMWSLRFWKEYIDTLARYRYNFVSLWSLHPFPSMVRVPEYPDVALDDVWRSKAKWKEMYSLQGRDFVNDDILSDVEVVRRMTIDEKIDFWRQVMAYGKSRNVDFYVVTWNIFTYGVDGKYGITDDHRNRTTVDYFRRSVAEMFRTYPDLAGVGLTTGENMPDVDFASKEDWAMAAYGQGVLDAAREMPDRQFTLIHRQHEAKATDISRTFKPVIDRPNVDFIFSFKYAKAHVYSAVTQPYHRAFVKDLGNLETIWTLRNDDVYYFRWGAADFVRAFVRNIPCEVSRGYYFGSDQYVWGREFLQRDASSPRELEIGKHWYQWMLWGRLGYNPNLDDARLQAIAASRFEISADAAQQLLDAWQHASMIYPLTTGFHWGPLDFQWYIEGCQSRPSFAQNESGFHDVNRFINLSPHAESRCQSIPDFVRHGDRSPESGLRTPFEVADELDRRAEQANAGLADLASSGNEELERTLVDIQIVAHLGRYYADKIRGAAHLAIYRASSDEAARALSIERLVDAAHHWHAFASLAIANHKNPLWTNRVGFVDWKQNYQYVLQDIRIAGGNPDAAALPTLDVANEPVDRPSEPLAAD